MEMNLEMMLMIETHSTPNQENEALLQKIACFNKGIRVECRRFLTSPG